jgi:hypothetical protein
LGLIEPQYWWSNTGGPGGATFSDPWAATTTVSYTHAGNYTHTVTAIGQGGVQISAVARVVVQAAATSGNLFPSTGTTVEMVRGLVQFAAAFEDQFDEPVAVPVDWSLDGVGEIDEGGTYTPTMPGKAIIFATAIPPWPTITQPLCLYSRITVV